MPNVEIEIDGKKLTAQSDQMVIQVADEAGIYIPRFCYHKLLPIAANCRMCLVEVEKSPKPLPACATPVMPGMKVFTRSAKAIAAQRAVMEFLLINHPLDCPICDQGGECELQDLAMGFGAADSQYCDGKRSVKDEDLGPLIATEMTRCIQCTRCVRFGDDVAGLRELGAVGRGEHMEIGTYVGHAMKSEVSGNIIDLCPVGALTSKPFRFTARAWELEQSSSIAPHDCVGSNIHVHTRRGKVMRVAPKENMQINETWLSDRDRFSYEGVNHPDRLTVPMMRVDNVMTPVSWQQALETASLGLQRVQADDGSDALGALASPNSTLEEFYLLQKLMRGLGCENIDHRLRQTDFRLQAAMPVMPGLGKTMADLETSQAILLIGSNIQHEQPLAALRVRKAVRKGAVVAAVNMVDYRFHFPVQTKHIVAPHAFAATLKDNAQALAEVLRDKQQAQILLGAAALNHPQAAEILQAAQHIAELSGASLGLLTEGANAAGAWLAGAVPHRKACGEAVAKPGLDAHSMLAHPRKAYVILNVEPEFDFANAALARAAFEQAEFIVVLSMYKNSVWEQFADIVLPIAPFTETAGTYINAAGEWQSFRGVAAPLGEARPAWKVLRVLGNFLHIDGFEYESADEVCSVLRDGAGAPPQDERNLEPLVLRSRASGVSKDEAALSRVGEIPLYAVDSIVRHARALQKTQVIMMGEPAARIHPQLAQRLNLHDAQHVRVKQHHGQEVTLPLVLDERIADQAVFIPGGIPETAGLGELFGEVEIWKA